MENNNGLMGTDVTKEPFDFDTVVLSMSGGMDSTCLALYWLAMGKKVHAIGFDYGQKHKIELKKAQKNVKFLQSLSLPIDFQVIDLKSAFAGFESSLTNKNEEVPHGNYDENNMKSTVVPNRNVIFSAITYGKALSIALVNNCNVLISLGLHKGDHTIYPDCRPESQRMAQELFRISNWDSEKVNYEAPFINIDKGDVLIEGVNAMKELGFNISKIKKVLKNTNTSYHPVQVDGKWLCDQETGSDRERLEAFGKLGMFMDPVPYLDEEKAKEYYSQAFEKFHPGKKVEY